MGLSKLLGQTVNRAAVAASAERFNVHGWTSYSLEFGGGLSVSATKESATKTIPNSFNVHTPPPNSHENTVDSCKIIDVGKIYSWQGFRQGFWISMSSTDVSWYAFITDSVGFTVLRSAGRSACFPSEDALDSRWLKTAALEGLNTQCPLISRLVPVKIAQHGTALEIGTDLGAAVLLGACVGNATRAVTDRQSSKMSLRTRSWMGIRSDVEYVWLNWVYELDGSSNQSLLDIGWDGAPENRFLIQGFQNHVRIEELIDLRQQKDRDS